MKFLFIKPITIAISLLIMSVNNHKNMQAPEENYTPSKIFKYSEDVSINYEILGEGDTSIIFLHGFGASLNSWNDIKNLFPLDIYKLFLIDLKGFGFSSKPQDNKYTIEDQANIIASFIEKNNLRNIILIGHSYGGGICMRLQLDFMKQNNPIIKKMILIDCAAYLKKLPFFIKYLRMPTNRLMFLASPKYRAKYTLKHLFFDKGNVTEEKINRYARFFDEPGAHYSFVKAAKQIIPDDYDSIIQKYQNIKIPVLIIWGKNDPILSIDVAKKLNQTIVNSRLEFIEQCGHIPQEECPDSTYKLIDIFLNKK